MKKSPREDLCQSQVRTWCHTHLPEPTCHCQNPQVASHASKSQPPCCRWTPHLCQKPKGSHSWGQMLCTLLWCCTFLGPWLRFQRLAWSQPACLPLPHLQWDVDPRWSLKRVLSLPLVSTWTSKALHTSQSALSPQLQTFHEWSEELAEIQLWQVTWWQQQIQRSGKPSTWRQEHGLLHKHPTPHSRTWGASYPLPTKPQKQKIETLRKSEILHIKYMNNEPLKKNTCKQRTWQSMSGLTVLPSSSNFSSCFIQRCASQWPNRLAHHSAAWTDAFKLFNCTRKCLIATPLGSSSFISMVAKQWSPTWGWMSTRWTSSFGFNSPVRCGFRSLLVLNSVLYSWKLASLPFWADLVDGMYRTVVRSRVPRRPNLDHVLRGDQRGIGNPSRPCQLTQRSKVIISSCALQVIVEEKEPATGSEIPLLLRVWPEFTDTFQSHLSRVCKSHWPSLSHLSHCHTGWHFQVNYYLLLPVTCNLIKAEMLFTGDT